jgi:serine/threonine protein kinase
MSRHAALLVVFALSTCTSADVPAFVGGSCPSFGTGLLCTGVRAVRRAPFPLTEMWQSARGGQAILVAVYGILRGACDSKFTICTFNGSMTYVMRNILARKWTSPSGYMRRCRKEVVVTASSVHSDGSKPAQKKVSSSTTDTDHWTQPSPAPVKMRKAPLGSTNNVVPTDVETCADLVSGSPQAPPDVQDLWEQLPAELQRGLCFVQVLGSGNFGVVVLAEKRGGAADERVAVKLVRPRTGEHALAMREGLVLSTIASIEPSAHIPKCLDYGMCDSGLVYSVIEFFAGVPLDKFLEQEGPLPPREVARVGYDICEALAVIHRAGFTYGDIKAQNIIRSSTGDPDQAIYRLVDFGSTSGFMGCLFGGMHGSVPSASDLSPATLASLVLSGAVPESWCGEGCRLEEDEQTMARLEGAWSALSSGKLPAHWRKEVDQEMGKFYDLNDVTRSTQRERERPSQPDQGRRGEEGGAGKAEVVGKEALEWFTALLREQDEVSGTPAYMAPEQMLQSRALITPQTDIYNLAALLFYLASRCLPLPSATARKWLRRVHGVQERDMELVSGERRQQLERVYRQHLAALFDEATPRLCHVIQDQEVMDSRGMRHLDEILFGALHKYPSLRYGDARQMQQRLSSLVCDLE